MVLSDGTTLFATSTTDTVEVPFGMTSLWDIGFIVKLC